VTISYTALQAAISNAASNTTTAVGNKLNKGTNSVAAAFPGGFYTYSAGNVSKDVTLPDPSTLTHDYRQGNIVRMTGYGNITAVVLTNVPYVGPSSSNKVLVPFTLIYNPSGSTTVPQITTVNGASPSFNRIKGSASVSDGDYVIVKYFILVPDSGSPEVYYERDSYL
jgi:hypothetical protein